MYCDSLINVTNNCLIIKGRGQHILDVTFDPLGEWLTCACLDGCLYLVPILTLMLPVSCSYKPQYGSIDIIILHNVAL